MGLANLLRACLAVRQAKRGRFVSESHLLRLNRKSTKSHFVLFLFTSEGTVANDLRHLREMRIGVAVSIMTNEVRNRNCDRISSPILKRFFAMIYFLYA
jgi:hypothetical protein